MDELALSAPTEGQEYCLVGEDVSLYRPVLTGDVFSGIRLTWRAGESAVMVIGHPCSIRRGATLIEKIPVVAVAPFQKIPPERWKSGYFGHFPLPPIPGIGDSPAAIFAEIGLAEASGLTRDARAAALTDRGIVMLQQRFVHHLTRTVIGTDLFHKKEEHVLCEAELEEVWLDAINPPEAKLDSSVAEFDAFMSEGEPSRRNLLTDRTNWTQVRQQVAAEARERQSLPAESDGPQTPK